jgi:hypothetical protein
MSKREKATKQRTPLRGIDGGKSLIRRAYETCRSMNDIVLDVPVITVLSPDDEAYTAEVAELLLRHA